MGPLPTANQSTDSLDALSYLSPARIRAFLCPAGPISRARFVEFVAQLQSTAVIRLGDVTPDPRPERVMFSPQGFPSGMLVYNFATTIDQHHSALEDLELFRRTLAVFGLVDYKNLTDISEIDGVVAQLQEQSPQAIIHKVILFDCPLEPNELPSPDYICLPPRRASRVTSIRTVICDLTSALLAELPLLAQAYQTADTIASPLARDDDYDSVILNSSSSSTPPPVGVRSSPHNSSGNLSISYSRDKDKQLSYPLSHHTERQRMRRKGRSMKMIANMYLLAGRTTDALKEYVEALAVLKGVNDHLWHATCIEGIGMCMIMLAFLNMPFTIPSVILPPIPNAEKRDQKPEPPHLLDLIPQMSNTVLSLYNRSQNFPGESVPQLTYVETILRTVNLLTCTCLAGGWNETARAAIVLSRPIPYVQLSHSQVYALKMGILEWISSAQAVRLDGVDAVDASKILTGIASACGKLGFYRKRGFVLRQLVTELIPRIVQARVITRNIRAQTPRLDGGGDEDEYYDDYDAAAELRDAGIRAGIPNSGILTLLNDICQVYGAPVDATDSISTFGWQETKTSILKMCIELCKVLPDHVGTVKYTTLLLRTAAGELSIDEQLSMVRSMREAYTTALTMGLEGFEEEYWDPYLVRDIGVVDSSLWAVPTRVEIGKKASDDVKGPFIYNPFSKKKDAEVEKRHLFVQDEPVEFRVLLQNPFSFELDIKAISLVGEGASFSSDVVSVIVPPRKIYPISIYLTPTSVGLLSITGCVVQVYGCKETTLAITPQVSAVAPPVRVKKFGLDARAYSTVPIIRDEARTRIAVDVVPPLPIIHVNRISLPQSSLMLLEGERRRFFVSLANVSDRVSATNLKVAFADSTTESLTNALNQGTRSESDRYEIEVFLMQRDVFRCVTKLDGVEILPNGELEIEVEVLGKRGLTTGSIDISYTHMDEETGAEAGHVYVRNLSVDLKLTVNASVEVAGCDFVPFSFNMPTVTAEDGKITTTSLLIKFLDSLGLPFEKMDDYCLMLLDLRNSWPKPLRVNLTTAVHENEDKVVSGVIQPGNVTRLLIPVRRIRDIDANAPVPSLMPPKQFTRPSEVSLTTSGAKNGGWSPDVERAVFWHREELLKLLRGEWYEEELGNDGEPVYNTHAGTIELRALRITPQMVDIIQVDDIIVDILLDPAPGVTKVGRRHWVIEPDLFVSLTTSVTASSSRIAPTSGVLRIQPTIRNLSPTLSLDVNRRILFNGILQQPVVNVVPAETRTVETNFIVLARGEYEFVASFEELGEQGQGKRYIGRDKVVITCL
ncbi:TRAPP II complex [Myxozyma melibiosi]|uniref:TRAPP II complex n=1 Tax=Myxozyma melibiosi TaxID=54550 RepID=A0ABR1F6J7_9ASCO